MKIALKSTILAALLFASGLAPADPKSDPAVFSAALFPAPQAELALPGVASNSFTHYDQIQAYLETIVRTSEAKLYSLLKTDQGREVWALKLPNPKAKLRVMVYARVHGNEPGASEGALQFLDALTRGELKGQYTDLELLVVPMANPDGSVANRRDTAKGGDINRDFVKYDYAETRAIQAEIQRFDPHVVVDAHEFTVWGRLGPMSSASDLQSAGPNEPNLPPELIAVHERLFRSAISANFAHAGLRHDLYELLSTDKQSGRLQVGESATTFVSAKNYHAMSGRISLLLESRGIGLDDQHRVRRTLSHYLAMKAVVQSAQGNADMLVKLLNDSRKKIAGRSTWEIDRKPIREERQFLLADSTSNSIVKVPADFINRTDSKATRTVQVPRYYLVPQAHKNFVDVLSRMGVKVDTLRQPLRVEVGVQTANLSSKGEAITVDSTTSQARRGFEAGDYVITTQQRAGLYLQTLEGASPNGFARAGLFGKQGTVELPFYRYDGAL